MQPNVKLNHNRVTQNILVELARLVDPSQFEISNGEFALQTGPKSVRSADAMVFPSGKAGDTQSVSDAVAVFEVLSPSTMQIDFKEKRNEYQGLPSVKAYVILAADEPQIWLWLRAANGAWPADPVQLRKGKLRLPPIGVSLGIAALYRDVTA